MKQSKTINYTVFDDPSALDAEMQQVLAEARKASVYAYAPYSHFCVGAALLLDDGTIIHGSNQENAAYPSGLCAERVAFFAFGAQYRGRKIVKAAVIAHPEEKEELVAASPCGSCLQVMIEYEKNQASPISFLFMGAPGRYYLLDSVAEFLPFAFGADNLLAAKD